jgi:hypothetical protein
MDSTSEAERSEPYVSGLLQPGRYLLSSKILLLKLNPTQVTCCYEQQHNNTILLLKLNVVFTTNHCSLNSEILL